jgi:isoleucyl-tRNA synthetase
MPEAPNPAGAQDPKPLKSTLNLPQTAFPMKANLPVNEPLRLKHWQETGLYAQIRRARAGAPRYILHDGPPYANGAIHLGHALNKTLKDFVVKTKTMAGFDAPYVPGWDCHGLPIEIKVDEQLGRRKLEMDPVQVRRACREYAQKYLDLQRSQFLRMGVFGRWATPYSTMDPAYEARIAETFFHFFENGFVYKGLKPVSWCIHDRTALAEAEVEYANHTSPSVYVRYKLTSDPANIAPELGAPSSTDSFTVGQGGVSRGGATALSDQPTKPGAPHLASEMWDGAAQKPDIYTIIWTTTPWTLPASLAVAFNPTLEYVALAATDAIYIVAADLAPQVIQACNLGETVQLARFPGTALEGTTFHHPFLHRQILGVTADYVTADQGTGAVHTAPAHGVDDFATGKRYNLPKVQYVDDAGRQSNTGLHGGHDHPQPYEGLTVFKSNPVIIELLREKGALLAATHFDHSYPHCWRCHNPVITRATEQWFIAMETPILSEAKDPYISPDPPLDSVIPTGAERSGGTPAFAFGAPGAPSMAQSDMGGLSRASATALPDAPTTFRERALEEIKTVHWDPAWGEERITNMVATRPDWCISRQRIWGVPIAVFLCRKCSTPLNNPAINKLVVALFMRESADAWYTHTAEQILPAGTSCAACGETAFRKEMDILDVWFESGASSHAVLDFDPDTKQAPGTDPRADLYAEGGDQHRGWFMSSLLCSIGMHNRAPFKTVATYGWTLDEQGRALSKSLGNFIDPVQIMDTLGGDIVRLWVASVDFREDVVASLPLLKRLAEEIYRKLRNTFRFLLGALSETNPTTGLNHAFDPRPLAEGGDAVPFSAMQPIDQYMLARTAELTNKITTAYSAFEFHRVYHLLNEFCNSELSAFYLDVLKDRLYTFPITCKPNRPPLRPGLPTQEDLYTARRSAQTALYKITDALARLTAPILSFTAEEVWQSLPHATERASSVHLTLFPTPESLAPLDKIPELLAVWKILFEIRDFTLRQLEAKRIDKQIGKSLEASAFVELEPHTAHPAYVDALTRYRPEVLQEFLNVSFVNVNPYSSNPGLASPCIVLVELATGTKCQRCLRYTHDVDQSPAYPTVCLRCVEALDAIDFPPYPAAIG